MQTSQLSYRTVAAPTSTNPEHTSLQAIEDKRKHVRVILRWLRASALRWLGFVQIILLMYLIGVKTVQAGVAMSFDQQLPAPDDAVVTAARDGWSATLNVLRLAQRKYVIVDTQFGLGNRLRTLASAMAVAAAEKRPLVLV